MDANVLERPVMLPPSKTEESAELEPRLCYDMVLQLVPLRLIALSRVFPWH